MRPLKPSPPRGFVLLVGLGLLLASALGLVFLGGVATVVTDKQRGNQLADAASLSVAQWYAQALNYQAYANRAIIANEVMIAQSLTALAWVRHANTLTAQAATVASFIPALQTFSQWAAQAVRAAQATTQAAAAAEVPFRSGYTRALQASQEAMQLAVNPFATQSLINEIIWSGDRRFFGQYLPTADVSLFYRAVKTYTDDARRPLAQHIHQELDSFSRGRAFDQRLYLLPTFTCLPTSLNRAFSRLIRQGGTALTGDMNDWVSADTLSVHQWFRRGRLNPSCRRLSETIPLAWGASQTYPAFGHAAWSDPMASALAGASVNPRAFQQARASSAQTFGYLGLSAYRDLSDPSEAGRAAARYRVPILVRLPTRNSQSATAVSGQNLLGVPDSIGQALWSLSVGLIEFVDVNALGSVSSHLPSLFMPYWRAQLTAPSAADEASAIAIAHSRRAP